MRITAKATGIDKVNAKLGAQGAKELEAALDLIVEEHALKIANEAKSNAPIKDGFLKRSIRLYGRPARLARTIGSNMPYATRQEYEHKTHKGYFRRAIWSGREPFRQDIVNEIKKRGG